MLGAGHTLSSHTLILRDDMEGPVIPAEGDSKVRRQERAQVLQMLNVPPPGL